MSIISINLKKDVVLIKIDDDAPQRKILSELNKKMKELKKMYQDEKTPIRVTGKVLTNKELEEVEKIIKREIDVEISFDTPTTLGLHSITRSYKRDVGKSETTFHRGSLRSGQKIEVEGSIVVIGDVNPGAEIVAEDNVIVMGALRGKVHAGSRGNTNAIVSAFSICPTQLRIADVITISPEQDNPKGKNPEIAYIKDGNIYIE